MDSQVNAAAFGITTDIQESFGTSLLACEYEDGVMIGADSRTSVGHFVANRTADKLTKITDYVYCCRSGSAADSQAVCDLVTFHISLEELENNEPASVYSVAKTFQRIMNANRSSKSVLAAFIIAGWDPKNGGQVYALPSNGVLTRQNCIAGGSGSSYILGYIDKSWKPKMKKEDCIRFMKTGLSLAMARDSASGGIISVGVLENGKVMERFVFGEDQINKI